MNAKEWVRIVDLLCQIKIRYAKEEPITEVNKKRMNDALDCVNSLLDLNELMALDQAHGWF